MRTLAVTLTVLAPGLAWAQAPTSAEHCEIAPVEVVRAGPDSERAQLRLVDCAGEPSTEAARTLSELARPQRSSERLRLNPGLLLRLQRIAERYPGRAIELVSGHRPGARRGSRHRSGDALDLRVAGVENRELSELARGFPNTGVGYYPNSSHVHIDVRETAIYWVDSSGPGEAPHYVRQEVVDPESDPGHSTKSDSLAGSVADHGPGADHGSVAEPESGALATSGSDPDTDPDAELGWLSDRALIVMNRALGREVGMERELPDRDETLP